MLKASTQVTVTYNDELRSYRVTPSIPAIEKDAAGVFTPSEIEWRSYYGKDPFLDGVFSVYESTDGILWSEMELNAEQNGEGFCKYTPTSTAIAVQCKLSDAAGDTVLDVNTVPVLYNDIDIKKILDNTELTESAKIAALRKLLSNNAETVTSYQSKISDQDGRINANSQQIESFINEYGEVINNSQSILDIGPENIRLAVEKYDKIIVFDKEEEKEFLRSLGTFFSVKPEGLFIQKKVDGVESPFNILIDNETIRFRDNEAIIAYISNRQLFIPDAVTGRQAIGNTDDGYFIWQVESNGSLTLKRRTNT